MESSVVDALLKQGAVGILALLEGFAIVALWRRNNTIMDARVVEAQKTTQVAEQVATALDRLNDTILSRGDR